MLHPMEVSKESKLPPVIMPYKFSNILVLLLRCTKNKIQPFVGKRKQIILAEQKMASHFTAVKKNREKRNSRGYYRAPHSAAASSAVHHCRVQTKASVAATASSKSKTPEASPKISLSLSPL